MRPFKKLVAVFAVACAAAGLGAGAYKESQQEQETAVCAVPGTQDFAWKLPDTNAGLHVLARLPLTGRAVYESTLKTKVETCEQNVVSNNGLYYPSSNSVELHAYKDGLYKQQVSFHEYFHGFQYANGAGAGFRESSPLSKRDAVFANLILESTAAAYKTVTAWEARDTTPLYWKKMAEAFPDRTDVFEKAYAQALSRLPVDDENRRQKAFEAGGQALVRYLLTDTQSPNTVWADDYKDISLKEGTYVSDKDEKAPGYTETRDRLYRSMGKVSPHINLTPDELTGQGAGLVIDDYLKKLGIDPKQPEKTSVVTLKPKLV